MYDTKEKLETLEEYCDALRLMRASGRLGKSQWARCKMAMLNAKTEADLEAAYRYAQRCATGG